MQKIFLVFLLALTFSNATETLPANPPKSPSKYPATLIFFMNPNGRPCQIQDEILNSSKKDWESRVQLRYVKTTVAADLDIFYQYGVRSLPTLILVDDKGKELHRFAPGIQERATILSILSEKIK